MGADDALRAARDRFAADVCKAHMADLEAVLITKEGRGMVAAQAKVRAGWALF